MRLAVLALAAACAGAPAAPTGNAGGPLSFGFTHPTGSRMAQESADRLSKDLTQALGSPLTVQVFPTHAALAAALARGQIDAAWMSPGAYVVAARQADIDPILKLSRNGFGRYRSIFFTRAGAGFDSLQAAKGKTFAIVAGDSMSGHLYPLAFLRRKGIEASQHFGKVIEGKDHEDVCRLVLDGKADVGVTLGDYRAPDELTADGCVMAGMDDSAFSVIDAVGPIPNDVIAVRASMAGAQKDRLRDALIDMRRTESGRAELKAIFAADGFVPANDTDFAAVRDLEQFMEN
ncbi:MAG TPA: phosphate/phosphite/phosphonate ABC transporter substrate-binding protein [Myxococcales bacterium]|nr:phosphate/phosphite/phosphonate ABC transporter substrate-binding protein [Myxococcales bacterium]